MHGGARNVALWKRSIDRRGSLRPHPPRVDALDVFAQHLRRKRKPRTAKNYLLYMRRFFAYLQRELYYDVDEGALNFAVPY